MVVGDEEPMVDDGEVVDDDDEVLENGVVEGI